MRQPLFSVLFFLSGINSLFIPSADHEYVRYLAEYGYLSWSSVSSSRGYWYANDNDFSNALKSFQRYVRIYATGVLDRRTKQMMSLARCEIKDRRRSKRSAKIGHWPKRYLTYRVMRYSSKISRKEVDSIIFLAFSVWSDPSDITIAPKKRGRVDVEIWFGRLSPRTNNRIAFGNTRSHSKKSIVTFNDDILWSQDFTTDQPNLFQTATHEIGHVLGLGHTNVLGAVMYPIYDLGTKIYSLHDDDNRGIQDIYKNLHVLSYPGRHIYRENAKKLRNTFSNMKKTFTNIFQKNFGITPDIEDINIDADFFSDGFKK